ncbi:polysaccharide pyruvyl transferase family protein [Gammaproteobacteria bacterium]|nr:polysaccharide pyruvyl transferase family protein [Gammaproteobacteria bacterium]
MAFKIVTLLGSSSGRNAGDAALMSGIMEAVDEACGERLLYEIPTIKPSYVRNHYQNCRTKAVPMLPWNLSIKMLGLPTYRSIMRADLILIFDAILFDRALYNPLFNFMLTLNLLLPMAKRKGKCIAYYDVGIGPVNTPRGKSMLRGLSDMMDFAAVRDQASYDILHDIGSTNPYTFIAADAALNVGASSDENARAIFAKLGLDPDKEILGINVNTYIDTWAGPHVTPMGKEKFVSTYAAAISKVYEKLKVPILLVSTQHADVSITKEVMNRLCGVDKVAMVTNVEYDHYDIKAVFSKLSLLFAMRLHSMILASSEYVPIVGLAYQPKIHHYFENLGLSDYSMDFGDFSESAIIDKVLNAWGQRDMLRSHLEKNIPRLKAEARKPAEIIAAMHKGETLDSAFSRII